MQHILKTSKSYKMQDFEHMFKKAFKPGVHLLKASVCLLS